MTYKPTDFPQLTPCLTVQDGNKALAFYQKAFGFELVDEAIKDEQGNLQYASLKLGECAIMIFPEGAYGMSNKAPITLNVPSPISLYIYVPNADKTYERALEIGAQSLMAPHDAFWGDRFCKVKDPDGHEWGFATYDEDRHAQHKQEKK